MGHFNLHDKIYLVISVLPGDGFLFLSLNKLYYTYIRWWWPSPLYFVYRPL